MRFKNKVVIVTGSSSGIGKSTAIAFAKEGAKVVICSRNKKACDETAKKIKNHSQCLVVKCDVSKTNDVNNLVKQTIKKFKKLDIIVNNAGVYLMKPLEKMTDDDWNYVININLKGPFLLCRAALPYLKAGSSIVNIASVLGEVGEPTASAYCASKGGLITLTKSLALELAAKKIRVNAIGPGPIKTPMLANVEKDPKIKKAFLDWVPLQRFGKPEEIANAVLFLASDQASYVTGTCLFVDGGGLAQ